MSSLTFLPTAVHQAKSYVANTMWGDGITVQAWTRQMPDASLAFTSGKKPL